MSNIIEQRRHFKKPQRTLQVLTLNGTTTIAANDELILTALKKSNRLKDINIESVALVQPKTGSFVNLNSPSYLYANETLILQTDDKSYINATSQHSFTTKLTIHKTKCHQCESKQRMGRFHHCEECSTVVCARCVKDGSIPQCSNKQFVRFSRRG